MQDGLFVCGTGLKQEVEAANEQAEWRTNKKEERKGRFEGLHTETQTTCSPGQD